MAAERFELVGRRPSGRARAPRRFRGTVSEGRARHYRSGGRVPGGRRWRTGPGGLTHLVSPPLERRRRSRRLRRFGGDVRRRTAANDSERGEATPPPPETARGRHAGARQSSSSPKRPPSSKDLLARSRAPRLPSPPALPRPTPRAADAPRRQDLQRAVDSPRSLRKQWALRRRASRPCSARPTTSAPGRAPCGGRALGITSNATAAS